MNVKVHQVIRMVLFLAYLGELQVDFVPLSLVVMQRLLYFVKRGGGATQNIPTTDLAKGWKLRSTGHIPGVTGSGMGALLSGALLWWELGDKVPGTPGWLTGEFCGKFLGVATEILH